MTILTPTQRALGLERCLAHALDSKYFNISGVYLAEPLLPRKLEPEIVAFLRTAHCVDWDAMPEALATAIRGIVTDYIMPQPMRNRL